MSVTVSVSMGSMLFWGMIPSHVVLNYFAAVILPWCWYGYSPCLPRWCNMFIHSCRLHLRVHSCFFSLQGQKGFVAELCLLVYNCSQPSLSEHKWSLMKYWWMESTLQKKTRAPQLAALISRCSTICLETTTVEAALNGCGSKEVVFLVNLGSIAWICGCSYPENTV